MARVAFFTERLPPHPDPIAGFSYELMRALAEQQHEVRIFSTYREEGILPTPHPRLEILRPFKTWGWLELPRLIPVLMDFRPQVLHVIQPRAEALTGFTNAMSAIPSLGSVTGRPAVVTSLFDVRESSLAPQKFLLQMSDLVTVTNLPQKESVAGFIALQKRSPEIEILPVPGFTGGDAPEPEHLDEAIAADPAESLKEFIASSSRIVFVPGDLDSQRSIDELFAVLAKVLRTFPDVAVLFGGGWGAIRSLKRRQLMSVFEGENVGARVFISGPLTPSCERLCLKTATVVFTAALHPESLELIRSLRDSLAAGAVPVMSAHQAHLDSLPWENRLHAFVAQDTPSGWGAALSDALASDELIANIRSVLPEFARLQALDQPGNVMSRLYARLIERQLLDRGRR